MPGDTSRQGGGGLSRRYQGHADNAALQQPCPKFARSVRILPTNPGRHESVTALDQLAVRAGNGRLEKVVCAASELDDGLVDDVVRTRHVHQGQSRGHAYDRHPQSNVHQLLLG
ncbi:hypothetical protein [Mycolicibacterium llatzerense]|uniref:hypothetical protein n=1 Tax=Mycolicibacterium llatzerense TaxID=280871 RepID=UPI0021B6C22E|nr:hypothetical protein [Mycolicibacterium llatzerense]